MPFPGMDYEHFIYFIIIIIIIIIVGHQLIYVCVFAGCEFFATFAAAGMQAKGLMPQWRDDDPVCSGVVVEQCF